MVMSFGIAKMSLDHRLPAIVGEVAGAHGTRKGWRSRSAQPKRSKKRSGYGTVKTVGLTAVPPGVVTWIVPVTAPVGTVAVTWVSELTVKVAVLPVANLTA